jgi:valyl-tRNA synthetase
MSKELEKLTKPYNPQETEGRIYEVWEKSGYFNPDNLPQQTGETFTVMMPPPNVTGVLHMGHGLMLAIEDAVVRYQRLRGKKTLWLPGTDHAAIATQSRVEKDIYKAESKSRHDLGREELIKRVEAFAQDSQDTIVSQIKTMGASCDWSREAFTLDKERNLAVRTMFKKMYDDGLIYRGYRVVNWDPKGQTTISDDEIVYEEREATLYTFKYSANFPIAIATTRPETKLGDVAVAVHPDDARYQQYVGQTFNLEFAGAPLTIKIIADKEVDPEFGTGAVGITPAHSHIDAAMAERHELDSEPVINELAKMTVGNDQIKGKKVTEAREAVVTWLKEQGLLEGEEKIKQNIATAERTGGIVEPLPKLQWFVEVNKKFTSPKGETALKEIMKEAVASGQIKILPDHFEKIYFHWIENLRDWCISRQIWYGHRVPVWYKGEEIYVGIEAPTGDDWEQDPDTLDTWFSSGLWTFSTLGWPDQTPDLKLYHPTNLLETGYEILFFWVARMIMMSGYALGEIPFQTVYLHGTVRDDKGRKMSKSLGNGLDPIDIAAEFGADAGRMALIVGNTPGTDLKISKDKIKAYKHFANKLWNITRFITDNTQGVEFDPTFSGFTPTDQTLIIERRTLLESITGHYEAYRLHLAAEELYHYAWHRLADELIEESKAILTGDDAAAKLSRQQFLLATLRELLITLHPLMPFVTEELWSLIKSPADPLLIVTAWPI